MLATVDALHALAMILRPTSEEFHTVIEFLTEVVHHVDVRRREWELFADVLGISSLIEDQNHSRPAAATPSALAGPFYRGYVPKLPLGPNISRDCLIQTLDVDGRTTMLSRRGARAGTIEVWQANADSRHENQQPDLQPDLKLPCRPHADAPGRFHLSTVEPIVYPLQSDGPGGRRMAALDAHRDRPAHLHFRVAARGCETLRTCVFDRPGPAVGHDAIFGVKRELLIESRSRSHGRGAQPCALDVSLVSCRERRPDSMAKGRISDKRV